MLNKYNIVLFGGSNSVIKNGLQHGLKQENINLINLAIGATTSIQNLYELKRKRNITAIENADLIITESNINDAGDNASKHGISINQIFQNLYLFYSELSTLNKKILILLLPTNADNSLLVNKIHIFFAKKFYFNVIDLNKLNSLKDFYNLFGSHQLSTIMRELGKNISKHIESFRVSKLSNEKILKDIVVCTADELSIGHKKTKNDIIYKNNKNSAYNEYIVCINNSSSLIFPKKYIGYNLLAIHTWNKKDDLNWAECCVNLSNIYIRNKTSHIYKSTNFLNSVAEIRDIFVIDNNTLVTCDSKNVDYTEYYSVAHNWKPNAKFHNELNLIGFLLMKPYFKEIEQVKMKQELDYIEKNNINLDEYYNFNHIIPPIYLFKEIIDEYCAKFDDIKHEALQKKLIDLNNKNKILIEKLNNLSKKSIDEKDLDIIENQFNLDNTSLTLIRKKIYSNLSYKLGTVILDNSNSLWGYFRMPFILSYIKDKHIYEQNNKKLNSNIKQLNISYKDIKNILEEKDYKIYRIGEFLIKSIRKKGYILGYINLLYKLKFYNKLFKSS